MNKSVVRLKTNSNNNQSIFHSYDDKYSTSEKQPVCYFAIWRCVDVFAPCTLCIAPRSTITQRALLFVFTHVSHVPARQIEQGDVLCDAHDDDVIACILNVRCALYCALRMRPNCASRSMWVALSSTHHVWHRECPEFCHTHTHAYSIETQLVST